MSTDNESTFQSRSLSIVLTTAHTLKHKAVLVVVHLQNPKSRQAPDSQTCTICVRSSGYRVRGDNGHKVPAPYARYQPLPEIQTIPLCLYAIYAGNESTVKYDILVRNRLYYVLALHPVHPPHILPPKIRPTSRVLASTVTAHKMPAQEQAAGLLVVAAYIHY